MAAVINSTDLDLLDGFFADRFLLLVLGLRGLFTDGGDLGRLAVAYRLQPLPLARPFQCLRLGIAIRAKECPLKKPPVLVICTGGR